MYINLYAFFVASVRLRQPSKSNTLIFSLTMSSSSTFFFVLSIAFAVVAFKALDNLHLIHDAVQEHSDLHHYVREQQASQRWQTFVRPHVGIGGYFLHLGQMTRTTAFGHLRVDIDLKEIRHNLTSKCASTLESIRHVRWMDQKFGYYTSNELTQVVLHIEAETQGRCDEIKGGFDHLLASYQGLEVQHREKRQLLFMAAGAAIFAAISALFRAPALASLTMNTGMSNHAIATFQDHEKRLTVMETRMKWQDLAWNDLFENGKDGIILSYLNAAVRELDQTEADARRILTGWEALFHHRLSPSLVHTSQMDAAVDRLQDEARRHGMELVSRRKEDVFQYSTSHLMDKDGKVTILVHCPLVPRGGLMDVYRYVPVPAKLNRLDVYLVARPTQNILAINRGESSFRVLSEGDLSHCDKTRDVYYCRDANYYDKRLADDCLVAIHRQDAPVISSSCPIIAHPRRDMLVALNNSAYAVYQAKPSTLKIQCASNPPIRTPPLVGTLEVTVPSHCVVTTSSFVMEGVQEIDAPTVLQGLTISSLEHGFSNDTFDALAAHLERAQREHATSQDPQEVRVKDLVTAFRAERASHIFRIGAITGPVISFVVLICLVLACVRLCRKKQMGHPDIPWWRFWDFPSSNNSHPAPTAEEVPLTAQTSKKQPKQSTSQNS